MSAAPVARPPMRAIRLRLRDFRGQSTSFKVKRDAPLEVMGLVVAQRLAVPRERLLFSHSGGAWLDCSRTPEQLGLPGNADIDCDLDVDMDTIQEEIPEDLTQRLGGDDAVVFCIRGLAVIEEAVALVDVPQHFIVKKGETLAKFLDMYAVRRRRNICVLRFTFNGQRVVGVETISKLGLRNGATIECESMYDCDSCSPCQLAPSRTASSREAVIQPEDFSSTDTITFRIKYKNEFLVPFTRRPSESFKSAFQAFDARTGLYQFKSRFWHEGWLVDERDTLESIGLQDGDIIYCEYTLEGTCAICAWRQQESVPLKLRIRDECDDEFEFKITPDSPFKQLYVQYADRVGVSFMDVLLFRGEHRILLKETPKTLKLTDSSVLTSIVFRSNACVCCKSRSMDVAGVRVRGNGTASLVSRNIIVTVRIVDEFGVETALKVWTSTKMRSIFEAYSEARMRVIDGVMFLFRGKIVHYDDSPASLQLTDHDVIIVGSQTTMQLCRGCNPAQDIRSHISRIEGRMEDHDCGQSPSGVLSVTLYQETDGGLTEFVRLWQQESRRRAANDLHANVKDYPAGTGLVDLSNTRERSIQLDQEQLERLRKENKAIAAKAAKAEKEAHVAKRDAQHRAVLARQAAEQVASLKQLLNAAVEAKGQAEVVAAKSIQTASDSRQKVAGEFAKAKKALADAERAMIRARNEAVKAKVEAEAEVARAKVETEQVRKKAFEVEEEMKRALVCAMTEAREAKAREVEAREAQAREDLSDIRNVTLVLSAEDGEEMVVLTHGTTQLHQLVSPFAKKFGLDPSYIELHWNANRLVLHETPDSIGLYDGCVLECVTRLARFCLACASRKVSHDDSLARPGVKRSVGRLSVLIVEEDLSETQATIPNRVSMGMVFKAFQAHRSRESEQLMYFYRGVRIRDSQTPESLELGNSSVLFCARTDRTSSAICDECFRLPEITAWIDIADESTSTEDDEEPRSIYARQIKMQSHRSSLGFTLRQRLLGDRPVAISSEAQAVHLEIVTPEHRHNLGNENHEAIPAHTATRHGKRFVTVHIKGVDGKDVYYKVKGATKLQKVFDAYMERIGAVARCLRFRRGDKWIIGNDTPNQLHLREEDVIECIEAETEEWSSVTPPDDEGANGQSVARTTGQVTLLFRDSDMEGADAHFTLKRTTPLQKAFDRFALHCGGQRGDLIFMLSDGRRLSRGQTPEMAGLQDGDEVLCFGTRPNQSRRSIAQPCVSRQSL